MARRQEEPPETWVNVELRIGSRRGHGGGPGGGPGGRKGHPAWTGQVPVAWLAYFAKLEAHGVPGNHSALYVYAQDEGDPNHPEDVPDWGPPRFTSHASMPESSIEEAELASGQDGLRQLSLAKGAIEQEMAIQQARKTMFEEQTREAESRYRTALEQTERLQRQLADERERCQRQISEEQERANGILKELDNYVNARRALAVAEEERLALEVEKHVDRLATQITGLSTISTTMLEQGAATVGLVVERQKAQMAALSSTIELAEAAADATLNAKQADPSVPTPGSKLADKIASVITADSLGQVLGTILTLAGKGPAPPAT